MSTGGIIAIAVAAIAVVFLAVNRGLVSAGVQVPVGVGGQRGIVAPQPAQNYGGYLAATTAPQVSSILNTALSGLNSAFTSWLRPSAPQTVAQRQGASPASPSLAAQPSGPFASMAPSSGGWFPGPTVDPAMSYNATPGSAFDYGGLASDNGFDSNASLDLLLGTGPVYSQVG